MEGYTDYRQNGLQKPLHMVIRGGKYFFLCKNAIKPIATLSLTLFFKRLNSTSAPAKKVSINPPKVPKKPLGETYTKCICEDNTSQHFYGR